MSNRLPALPLAPPSQGLPRLTTARLEVRIAQAGDADAISRYVNENAAFLQPWEPKRAPSYYTPAYWRLQIARDPEDFLQDRGVRFFLFDRTVAETRVMGVATFGNLVRGAAQYCTLGYAVAQSAQGSGLMREALEDAAIPYVFREMRLHRIHANYIPRNERSGGLLRRLGFSVDGYARDYLFINERWEDHILTSRTNEDWHPHESF
ncbi:MAG: GNAT family N-acetyltransferase [Cytophagales bacterium]|nr:GNAT family N-acetyltransferase [Armatimonadota bacterium]